jgi:phage major head subunit gpT-like protein
LKITKSVLLNTTTAFNTLFNSAFAAYKPSYEAVAMTVPSGTGSNDYRWLGKLKGMREWIGERVINNLEEHGYTIRNKRFENTVGVDADDIEDDQIGVYNPLMSDLGATAAEHPDHLVYGLLKAANSTVCFDGQNFADTDHPVVDAQGVTQNVSNYQAGSGEAWFLMVTTRPVKPIIYQERRKARFTSLDNPDDPNVFFKNEFVYGVDGRWNVGFGLWQLCYMSKQPLTAENYSLARAAIMSFTGDGGRPLNLVPNLLVVGGGNEGAARKILNNEQGEDGESNEWKGTATLHLSPLLTGA